MTNTSKGFSTARKSSSEHTYMQHTDMPHILVLLQLPQDMVYRPF